ncbi:MAG: O-antigen ligase family protein [Azoarcus sp.]|jgi:O-antigen ligase|nr:O-antigen ligase family protein [Azoarcus sp.]
MQLTVSHVEDYVRRGVVLGLLIYLAAFFVVESSKLLSFFLMFVVLPALCMVVVSYPRHVINKRVLFFLTTFLGYLCLSALWGEGDFLEAVKYSFFILFLMVSVATVSQRLPGDFVTKYIVALGLISSLGYIIAMFLSAHGIWDFVNQRFAFRDIGGWGSKNPVDSATIISIPVLASWWLLPGKKWHAKLLLMTTIIACAAVMLVTKSRGPALSLGIVLVGGSLLRHKKSDIFILLLLGLVAGIVFFYLKDFIAVMRLDEGNYRYSIWMDVLGKIKNNWLFGQGYGTHAGIVIPNHNWELSHSHNMFLEVLRIGGVVGIGLLGLMLVSMLRRSYPHEGNFFFLAWLFFGFICLCFSGRLPLIKPTVKEFVEFWLPLFLSYFYNAETQNYVLSKVEKV